MASSSCGYRGATDVKRESIIIMIIIGRVDQINKRSTKSYSRPIISGTRHQP